MQVNPSELLLTPSMSYTISKRGGPLSLANTVTCYSSSDEYVAKVNELKKYTIEIDGFRVGDAQITYKIMEGNDCSASD